MTTRSETRRSRLSDQDIDCAAKALSQNLAPTGKSGAPATTTLSRSGENLENSSSTWILLRRTVPKAAAIFAYAAGSVIAFLLFAFILGGAFGAFFTGCRLLSFK